ncbi:MAG: hypothetical protein SNH94_07700 [Rikenellaceae bacterium]
MKKIILSFAVLCAGLMVACGNAEIDKINQLIVEATEQTLAAESSEEVAQIATTLQEEMEKIAAEAGDKFSIGKSVEEALTAYQEAAAAKLAEFGIELE